MSNENILNQLDETTNCLHITMNTKENIINKNLDLLAGVVAVEDKTEEEGKEKMARPRSFTSTEVNQDGHKTRKMSVMDKGITIRNKTTRTGTAGIYNSKLMPDLTPTQCSIKDKLDDEILNTEINVHENNDPDDDDEENCGNNENDDDSNLDINKTTNKRNIFNNTLLSSSLENMSTCESSDVTSSSTSREDYINHCENNGLRHKPATLRDKVSKIVKYAVWGEYKVPDKFDYVFMSDFSKIILTALDKRYERVTIDSQHMWDKITPMIRCEYQIIRSTMTQAMKLVFFGK